MRRYLVTEKQIGKIEIIRRLNRRDKEINELISKHSSGNRGFNYVLKMVVVELSRKLEVELDSELYEIIEKFIKDYYSLKIRKSILK